MRMSDRLACCLTNIDAYVVAAWHDGRFDVTPNLRQKGPNRGLFFTAEGKEVTRVSPGNNQAMSLIQRKGVGKRHGEVVRGNETSARQLITEDTSILHGCLPLQASV